MRVLRRPARPPGEARAPEARPARFIWYGAGGENELHLQLVPSRRRTSRTSALRSTTSRAAGPARESRVRDDRPDAACGRPRFMCRDPFGNLIELVTDACDVVSGHRLSGSMSARAASRASPCRTRASARDGRGGLPALDPAARLGRAGSRGLVAGLAGGARPAAGRASGVQRPDARACRARRWRPGPAAGDPLERPANRCRVRRDRAPNRPRAPDRAHREPGSDRIDRPEAPLARAVTSRKTLPRIRHVLLPKDYASFDSTASARPTSPTPPGRCSSTSPGVAGRTSLRGPEIRSNGCRLCRESTEVAGAGYQAAAALRRGVIEPGPVLRRARNLRGRPCRASRLCPRPRRASTSSAMRCRARGMRWGRRCARPVRPRGPREPLGATYGALDVEAARWAPGAEGLRSPPTWRASARPTRIRPSGERSSAFRSVAIGGRSPVQRSRASPTASAIRSSSCGHSVSEPPRPGLGGGARSTSGCRSSPRSSVPARVHGRRGGRGLRGGAARRASARACSPTPREAVARYFRVTERIDPEPGWVGRLREYRRFATLYPKLSRNWGTGIPPASSKDGATGCWRTRQRTTDRLSPLRPDYIRYFAGFGFSRRAARRVRPEHDRGDGRVRARVRGQAGPGGDHVRAHPGLPRVPGNRTPDADLRPGARRPRPRGHNRSRRGCSPAFSAIRGPRSARSPRVGGRFGDDREHDGSQERDELALIRESARWCAHAHRPLQEYSRVGAPRPRRAFAPGHRGDARALPSRPCGRHRATGIVRRRLGRIPRPDRSPQRRAHAVRRISARLPAGAVPVTETSAPIWGFNAELGAGVDPRAAD